MTTVCALATLFAVSVVLGGCPAPSGHHRKTIPEETDDGWKVASPARFGADVQLLESIAQQIDAGEYSGIHSVLVAKEGKLVLEYYFDGDDRDTLHEIRSATKSIGSILTGIAIDRGFLRSAREPVHRLFEETYEPAGGWSEEARQIEIRHLLSMTSGYDCDDLATDFACEHAMHLADDWVQYSLDLPIAHPAGERWAYNSSSLILVGEAVASASGLPLEKFATRYLFEPLGIVDFHWQVSPKGRAWIGGGARMTPREMLKIGQLMLNRGMWSGRRLLSEEWIDESTRKQSDPRNGVDYGYLWQIGDAYIGRESVSAFWASGNGGQYIIVVPEHEMVVVFTGGNYDSPLASQPFRLLTNFLLPAFMHPQPLAPVLLGGRETENLAGTYHLDFAPSVTAAIAVHDNQVHLDSPDGERIDLAAHSPLFFSGVSRYGPLTAIFEADDDGDVVRLSIYGNFQRFVFVRDP